MQNDIKVGPIADKIRALMCYKSQINTGDLDPYLLYVPERFWKGSEVSYSGLHKYLRRNYTWSKACEQCGQVNGKIDLANMTGVYDRDPKNWMILCRRCHIKEDHANPKKPNVRSGW